MSIDEQSGKFKMVVISLLVVVTMVFLGMNIILPTMSLYSVSLLEGSAPFVAMSSDFALESYNSVITPIYFSYDSFMLQIYCDEIDHCPAYLRHLYRQGKALKDTITCNNSYCICLGTFNESYNDGNPIPSGYGEGIQPNISNKMYYTQTTQVNGLLTNIFKDFLYADERRIEKINCAPSNGFLIANDYECEQMGGCFNNIFTHMYAYGSYSFSAMLEKSLLDNGVEMKVIW